MAKGRSVKCIDTNEIYGSLSETCRETGMTYDILKKCIDNGTLAPDGNEYRYIDDIIENETPVDESVENLSDVETVSEYSEIDNSSKHEVSDAIDDVIDDKDTDIGNDDTNIDNAVTVDEVATPSMRNAEYVDLFNRISSSQSVMSPGDSEDIRALSRMSEICIDKGISCGIEDNDHLIFFDVTTIIQLKQILSILDEYKYTGECKYTKWSMDRYTIITS